MNDSKNGSNVNLVHFDNFEKAADFLKSNKTEMIVLQPDAENNFNKFFKLPEISDIPCVVLADGEFNKKKLSGDNIKIIKLFNELSDKDKVRQIVFNNVPEEN
ncbi:hypothetical protein DRQ07_08290 [candidate division KSB1 bacterium]|nr:MAG: hypothetical protein DRQ07_08290 [candidate division KSB1 bacterium]